MFHYSLLTVQRVRRLITFHTRNVQGKLVLLCSLVLLIRVQYLNLMTYQTVDDSAFHRYLPSAAAADQVPVIRNVRKTCVDDWTRCDTEYFHFDVNIKSLVASSNLKYDGSGGEGVLAGSAKEVAIIVPYRDRPVHLKVFIEYISTFLERQSRSIDLSLSDTQHTVYIVEQDGSASDLPFNRGLLLNVGAFYASTQNPNTSCFIFHDIDLLPEDVRNLYTCPLQPRHMSPLVNTLSYKLIYPGLFGGVSAISADHFTDRLNGYSNAFWGWGGEDDDMASRIVSARLSLARYPLYVGRYTMLKHGHDKVNSDRYKLLHTSSLRMKSDGFHSLNQTFIDENVQVLQPIADISSRIAIKHIMVNVSSMHTDYTHNLVTNNNQLLKKLKKG